jgi:hypothetical protein
MTTAEWMFGIIEETFTFSISTELFDALDIRNLLFLNKSGITLSYLARNYLNLWRWVWIVEKAAISVRAHRASAE